VLNECKRLQAHLRIILSDISRKDSAEAVIFQIDRFGELKGQVNLIQRDGKSEAYLHSEI
jgi:hypothetical protein